MRLAGFFWRDERRLAAVSFYMLGVTRSLTPSDWRIYDGRRQITDEGYAIHCELETRVVYNNKYMHLQ